MTRKRGLTIAALVAIAGVLQAGPYDDELRRYDYEIEWRTIETVNDLLKPADFAIQKGYRFPVMPPARRADKVRDLIEAELERVVEEKYPQEHFEEIAVEAEQEYRLYQVGDEVTLHARLRGPEEIVLQGTLRLITLEHIKLNDTTIALVDLSPDDRAHFDRFLREDAIKTY